jgi:hypothetical protein
MSNFVYDNTSLPDPKSDATPGVPPTSAQRISAVDFNTVRSAVNDLRTAVQATTVYNVLYYGAKGDGATDDTAAVNAAIVAAGAAGGGFVYLPPTSTGYRFTGGLVCDYDNVFIGGAPGRHTLATWAPSFTGTCISLRQTSTYPALRFNTGLMNLRIEPQNASVTAAVYTLRAYDCYLDNLRIDGFGVGASTGTAILLDYGGASGSDYGTGHRIRNCTLIGWKKGIAVAGANPQQVTDTVVLGCFIYGEAQAASAGISDLYDGSSIIGTEIEGHTNGVVLNNQGCSIIGCRFEANTAADVWFRTNAYNCIALGNHHANGSGGNVFESSTSQRQNYVFDGTLGFASQMQETINRACRTSTGAGPVDKWYQYGESATPGYWAQLTGTSGGTNPFGESVSTRELALAAGDFLLKLGTIANRAIALYVNSLPTLTLARGSGENTLTTDANTLRLVSAVADSGTAVAHAFDTSVSLSTTGAKIASFRKATSELAYVDKDGKVMGANLQAGTSGTNTVTCGTIAGGGQLTVKGNVSSTGSSIAVRVFNSANLAAGDKIIIFCSDNAGATQQLTIDKDGVIGRPQAAATTGAPGAATANVAAGRSAIASAAASVVITNSLVTATSRVYAQLQANDATATFIKSVIPAAGSFTVTVNAAATSTLPFAWEVFN